VPPRLLRLASLPALALTAVAVLMLAFGAGAPALAQTSGPIPYNKLYPQARRAAPARTPPRPAAARPPPAAPLAPPTLDPVRLEAYVDGLVTAAMAEQKLAGVAVAVVQNGQVVLKKGYGVDRLSPRRSVNPDRTLFRLGSISKTFTWIALQKEIESGRMRLDAPVNLYLPEPLQIKDQGFESPVRLRHLMTHTPGFEDRMLGQLFERDWRRVRPLNTYLRQEQPRRVREPGQLVSYSNYGAALAGAAMANVKGDTFERIIEREILLPAGLSRTTFREPRPERQDLPQPMRADMAADVSQGFGWSRGAFIARPFEHIGQIAPAGSASATSADMARYMTLLLGGGVIDGQTVWSPVVDRAIRTSLYRPAPQAAGWTAGFQDIPLPGGRRGFGHMGQTLSFRSNMVLTPTLNLGVFVATNSEGGAGLVQSLPVDIVRQMYGPAIAPPPVSATPADADDLTGRYLSTRRPYAGLEAFVFRFISRAQVLDGGDGRLVVRIDGQERAWLPAAQAGLFRAADGGADPMVFRLDANGRGRVLFAPFGGAAYERQGLLDSVSLMAVLAAAAATCALATLGGLFAPLGAPMRQTLVQSRTALSQTLQSVLWLIAFICVAIWAGRANDMLRLAYEWPGGLLVTASACALVAGALGVINIVLLPIVWRGGRRVDSWNLARKLRFTVTCLIFGAFTMLVGLWGGLTPWVA
jgi:CubicO group peptidase (beta-lactamase class C family)